jgi:hypothetical protein
MLFDPMTAITVVKGRVQPNGGEAVEAGPTAENAGGRQGSSIGKCCTERFSATFVQFDGERQVRVAPSNSLSCRIAAPSPEQGSRMAKGYRTGGRRSVAAWATAVSWAG